MVHGDTTKTAITLNPDQFIKRKYTPSTAESRFRGRLMIVPPAKKQFCLEYGYKESWLDNFELS